MDDWWKGIPMPEYPAHRGDNVTYTLTKEGAEKGSTHTNTPCFGGHRTQMAKYVWRVWGTEKGIPLEPEEYAPWVELCKTYEIMPPNGTVIVEDGRSSIQLSGHHHQVFTGLCCARWAGNLGCLPRLVMALLAARPTIHFFQALHFALKKYNKYYAHSFADFIQPESPYCPRGAFLAHSLVMSAFFRDASDPQSPCRTASLDLLTSGALTEYGLSLGFSDGLQFRGFRLENDEDLLWDEWAELYQHPEPAGGWTERFLAITNARTPKKARKK